MSRTVVLVYASEKDAQAQAVNYSNDYNVTIIQSTDQVMFARETDDGVVWRSGATADFYVMIATKAPVIPWNAPTG